MMSKKVSQLASILFWMYMSIQWFDMGRCAEMGPLRAKQRYPLYIMFLTPEPDSPRLIEKGRFMTSLSVDYTSIYIDETNREWSVLMDMEMTGIVLISDPETDGADIRLDDMMTLLAGIEYEASETLSLMGQFNFVTSPFHHTGIDQMDQDSLELALGFAVSMSHDMIFEFAFSEDLTRTAPDFTVHGALRYEFGP